MHVPLRSWAGRLVATVLCVAAALAVRLAIGPILEARAPYTVLVLGVVVAAWLGGLGAGLLATALAGLGATYWFVPPVGSLIIEELPTRVALLAFIGVGVAVSAAIDALHRARARAERSAEDLRVTLEAVPAAVFLAHDPEATHITANAMGHRMLGTEPAGGNVSRSRPGDPPGFRFFRGEVEIPPSDLPQQRIGREGTPIEDEELVVRRPDGTSCTMYGGAVPILDRRGRVRGSVAAYVDITRLREAEASLRESEQRLQLALSFANLGAWDWDLATGRNRWNEEGFRIMGCPAPVGGGEVDVSVWRDRVHPDDLPHVLEAFREAVEHDAPYRPSHRVFRVDTGEERHLEVTGKVIRDRSGRALRLVGVVADVTERRLRELELRHTNAELERFASVLAHDVREPLRTIGSFAQLLARQAREVPPEEAEELARFVVDGVRRLDRLTQDLLVFARAARPAEAVDVSMEAAADRVLAGLKALVEERRAKILRGPLPNVHATDREVDQLLQNLLQNALTYSSQDRDPVIEIAGTQTPEGVRVEVTDNGRGIDPAQTAHALGAFARPRPDGTGLGLAICKRIVEARGGRLWIESQPGAGTRVSFILPDARAGVPPPAVSPR